jgi:hypothetical protein
MTDTEKAEYESVVGMLTAKLEEAVGEIDRLQAVVAKLTGTDDAHSTLRRLYLDETLPPTARIRAAQAAIGHESAPLKAMEPPLNLVAEEYEPLAVVVERQRARCRALQALPLEERERMVRGVTRDDGNGSGDGSSGD